MASNRSLALSPVGLFVFLNCLLVALLHLDARSRLQEPLILGFFFGTLFSHTTLIASWLAFAPKTMAQRLALAVAWALMMAAAITCNVALHGGHEESVAFAVLCVGVQFLLLQLPLWILVLGFGFQLRHGDDHQAAAPPIRQFSISQLILLTTVVGVSLGVGRIAAWRWREYVPTSGDLPFLIFFLLVAVVLTLPVLLLVLSKFPQYCPVVLPVLIGVTTASEQPVMGILEGGAGPPLIDLLALNVGTVVMILIPAGLLRFSGYRLIRNQRPIKA